MLFKENVRLRFGAFCLDTGNRVLTRDGMPVALSPKTLDLLLYLLSNPGRLITRAELMGSLWPGVFVEESSLAFQVSTLRKMLGEEAAPWIETVPKHGYRFTAPVLTESQPPPLEDRSQINAPEVERPPLRARRRTWFWAASGLVVCVALATGGSILWRGSNSRGGAGHDFSGLPIPITANPGYESQPSLSPDGSQVAYSWSGPNNDNIDVYIKLVGPSEPIRITSDPLDDLSPQWSPDGKHIAFIRFSGDSASVVIVPALGGAERRISRTSPFRNRAGAAAVHHLTWTPDSKYLIAPSPPDERSPLGPTGLALIDIETGEGRQLTNPSDAFAGDYAPVVSSDGKRLALIRITYYRLHEILVFPLGAGYVPSGPAAQMLRQEMPIGGLAWTADQQSLVYSIGGDLGVRRLERLTVTGPHARERVPLGVGEQATTISIRGNRLVYARQFHDSNIWAYPIDPAVARIAGSPKRLEASSQEDFQGELSPDGRLLTFVSSRSGFAEIWIANADGSSPRQMTRMQGPKTAGPHWSPDGRSIVFDSLAEGRRYLAVLNVAAGEIRKLPQGADSFRGLARWSPDGKSIYYTSVQGSDANIWKTSADGGPGTRITTHGGIAPVVSPDGDWIYYTKDSRSPSSIWKVPANGGEESEVVHGVSYADNFVVTARGIYMTGVQRTAAIGSQHSLATLEFYDFATSAKTLLLNIGKPHWYGCTRSPDGSSLLISQVDEAGSNLMLVENFLN